MLPVFVLGTTKGACPSSFRELKSMPILSAPILSALNLTNKANLVSNLLSLPSS